MRVIGWNTNHAMSFVINDDKQHPNYKASADNLRLTRHARDNTIGMMNYDVALRRKILILLNDHEIFSDTAAIALKRLIYKLFSTSSDELSLGFWKLAWTVDIGHGMC